MVKVRWYDYFTSWLFWVNFLFLQWFFIRLRETVEWTNGKEKHIAWDILRWVVPFTGWWTTYKFWPKHVPHRSVGGSGKRGTIIVDVFNEEKKN